MAQGAIKGLSAMGKPNIEYFNQPRTLAASQSNVGVLVSIAFSEAHTKQDFFLTIKEYKIQLMK